MHSKRLLVFSLIVAGLLSSVPQAMAQAASPPKAGAPVLTLEDAVSIALQNNRLVKTSSLEAQKFDLRVNTAASRRLPQFQFAVLGGELLQPFNFTFPKGSFGTYQNVGPIPNTDAKIHTPATLTTYVTGGIDQPLSQLYKINLGIRATEIGRDIAREDVSLERLKVAAQVRSAYFEIIATQAEVGAGQQAVKTLEEAQRITTEYQTQQTVLRGDALDVDARLEKSRYELSVAENSLASEHEYLNQLLGRDVGTDFRVDAIPENDATDLTIDSARERAASNRPELRQAKMKELQAQYDRRIAKAQYIPDLSISVRYMGLNNVEVLPSNVGVAGFLLTWEPFDFGRRHNALVEKTKTVEQARLGVQETGSKITVEVGMTYRKWQETTLLLKATRTAREAAAEQFRVTANKYKEQAALIKDLLQAQARSSEADSQYQHALSSYWTALSELRRVMGEE
jgi:outer membrane protein